MRLNRVLVCFKKTLYERFRHRKAFKDVIERLGQDNPRLERVMLSHQETIATRRSVKNTLRKFKIEFDAITKPVAVNEDDYSLALVVGGDGTMLDYARYIKKIPVLGVNSSPTISVGRFYYASAAQLEGVLEDIRDNRIEPVSLKRLQVSVDDVVYPFPVLNEVLFSHQIPAVTSRYILRIGEKEEEQRSSGVWVATAAGSSGALHSAGGEVLPATSNVVQYLVREPFIWPPTGSLQFVLGRVPEDGIHFISKMFRGGVYMDGARGTLHVGYMQGVSIKLSEHNLLIYLRI